ncbi:hypothetical protein OG194_33290 [Streptomyces sp. NBC_01288]|uniref:hypothetical protein n=1 Tax=Streptomyces sp. NBC_01288 TaxID=2903814 RepID=UPI002E0E927A|nr:hypothetical protein OG194_33290 [Streptomyces sp. NBC_01288]
MRTNWAGGGRVFGYARARRALVAGSALACVLETLTMSVLLRDWPLLHQVVPVLGLLAVTSVAALHAASVTRPHQLDTDTHALRLRRAARADVIVPLGHIASAEGELRVAARRRADGELDLPVAFRTSVTLQLTEPVTHFTLLGRRREVDTVHFHADDADRVVATLQAHLRAVRRARTVPSTSPGPPG